MITESDRLNAAACLWEAVLSLEPSPECFDDRGTAAIRVAVCNLAGPACEAWNLSPEAEIGDCFDWDFIPRFLDDCVEWTVAGPALKPDWRDLAAAARAVR